MSLILPAFSSPDLKAFPLCSKSSKSSEGGQGETVSSVSAFFQSYLRSSLQEAATPATDSPDTRFSVMAAVVLSGCLCQSRKDPYLPLEPQCVRLLPRPTGLPPMAFVADFRLCSRRRETRPQIPQAKENSHASGCLFLHRRLPPAGGAGSYINAHARKSWPDFLRGPSELPLSLRLIIYMYALYTYSF